MHTALNVPLLFSTRATLLLFHGKAKNYFVVRNQIISTCIFRKYLLYNMIVKYIHNVYFIIIFPSFTYFLLLLSLDVNIRNIHILHYVQNALMI